MKNFEQRVKDVATSFLDRSGCEILERDWEAPTGDGGFDIIAMDEGTIVFVKAHGNDAKRSGFDFIDPTFERGTDESNAIQYIGMHADDIAECPIRFDAIAVTVIAKDRAVIRHNRNCMSTYDLGEE